VTNRTRHLHEEHLMTCYVAERCGDPIEARTAEHLAVCSDCRGRFDELTAFMEALRSETDYDSDTAFPVEWRHQQLLQITRRIEHLGHPARVISFPARRGSRAAGSAARTAPRWAAAAAAAGLFIGIALGSYYDLASRPPPVDMLRGIQGAVSNPAASPSPPALLAEPVATRILLDDDAFLSELEIAVAGPHTRELEPFYAFTPSIMEASAQLR